MELKKLIERKVALTKSSQRSPSPQRGCYKCGDTNHFQRNCPRSPSRSPDRKADASVENDDEKKMLKIGKEEGGSSIRVPVQINSHKTKAVIDTGAEITVLSQDFVKKVDLNYSCSNKVTLLNAETGNKMMAVNNVSVRINLGKSTTNWKVCIAPIRDDVLIGMDLLMAVDAVVLARQGDLLVKGELVLGNTNTVKPVLRGHLWENDKLAT
ncbi:uncharacterized protein LOC134282792 [Saccostrea cucullata]|uniref:uncharacterized protein LOC134282792 n=1 Tax=Saccostrea cuccullata TaxID=36930 RepID=UPI002ECFC7A0